MKQAELPDDEQLRLQALHALKLLDTYSDDQYDRVVRLAAAVFDVPIALFTLVDAERLWLKAKVGLNAEEMPRDISLCSHAILQEEALVVKDAAKDPRFHDSPLVTDDPRIRFYAGQSIKSPDGYAVGTLCVSGQKPREELSERQLQSLRDLASIIEGMLAAERPENSNPEAREQHQQLRSSAQLDAIARLSKSARVVVDSRQRLRCFTPAASEFFALEESSIGMPFNEVLSYLDYPALNLDLSNVADFGETIERSARSIKGRLLLARLTPFREPGSSQQSVILSLTDITAEEEAKRLGNILDTQNSQVVVIAPCGTIVFTNEAWDKFNRENGDTLMLEAGVGSNYLRICRKRLTEEEAQATERALQEMFAGRRASFEKLHECHTSAGKRVYSLQCRVMNYGGMAVAVTITDITSLLPSDFAMVS